MYGVKKQEARLATHPSLRVSGARFDLMPEGAAWLADERLLVVADLHFEKGSAFAERGIALPPYDTRATIARLEALVAKLKPDTLVAPGDSFHAMKAAARLDADAAARRPRLPRPPARRLGPRLLAGITPSPSTCPLYPSDAADAPPTSHPGARLYIIDYLTQPPVPPPSLRASPSTLT